MTTRLLGVALGLSLLAGPACNKPAPADRLLVNAHVYTMTWDDPDREGHPAKNAPHDDRGWRPDAEAIAIRGDRIIFVGSQVGAEKYRGASTTVHDLAGAAVLPGLIESHVHLENLGASLERVNLVGVKTEDEAVARVVERAAAIPKGEWIIGWGWDEGAWASKYPNLRLLSDRVPDHPVLLHGLHTFASWGNRLALVRAGITPETPNPAGGEIRKDQRGQPTGIFLNSATRLVERAIPAATDTQVEARIASALNALAAAGYVYVQEAGAGAAVMRAIEKMRGASRLPLRLDAMLAAREPEFLAEWLKRGPDTDGEDRVVVRSVKAFYDGAMGSRGAFFLDDYSDRPGHRGVGGADYGFDVARMEQMAQAGFQLVVHAIGDRANRETLDLFERLQLKNARPRIEHAQVVSPADLPRFAALGAIASMQPSHAVEDMPWAEARIGPERVKGAYAWRSLRRAGARLAFNSDLPATDHSIFYGLHSAVTRKDKHGEPAAGWRTEERMTIEEAIRGWTTWGAYAVFQEDTAGTIAVGRRADLTVTDIDPFQIDPSGLLAGKIITTIIDGRTVYQR